jgi:hypothetical protein
MVPPLKSLILWHLRQGCQGGSNFSVNLTICLLRQASGYSLAGFQAVLDLFLEVVEVEVEVEVEVVVAGQSLRRQDIV